MYCRHCGKELVGQPNYCRYCGWQLNSDDIQDKNSCISLEQQDSNNNLVLKKKQDDLLKQEKKKLRRETSLYTVFSIFVISFFILCIIMIQNNPSLVSNDNQENTQDFLNDSQEVTNVDKIKTSKSEREEELNLGSAKFLEGDNILISIFVDINGDEWTEEEKEYSKDSLEEAVTWIEKEGENYNKQINFIYDMDSQSDLLYSQSISFEVDSDSKDTNQYEYYIHNKIWIRKNIDIMSIKEKYKTDSIGYLFFLKDEGTSYTYSHFIEDENINKEEMCTIYLEDSSSNGLYENPATYAHEILHLYGALDLYDGASPEDINDYVIETYPYEIMLSTYIETLIPNEYDEVKMVSPITAYMLNWVDDIEELTWFPKMGREDGGCFSEKDFGGYYFNDEKNKEFDEVDPGRS